MPTNFRIYNITVIKRTLVKRLTIITEEDITNTTASLFDIKDIQCRYTELRSQRKGGGIIIYAHKSISFTKTQLKTVSFECMCGELEVIKGYKINLCSIYRPPNLNKMIFISELSNFLSKYPTQADCILVGDMNIDISFTNIIVSAYLNSLNELGFDCCITNFTESIQMLMEYPNCA